MREEQDKVLVFDKARYKRAKQEPSQIRQDDEELIKMCELICEFGQYLINEYDTDHQRDEDVDQFIEWMNNNWYNPLLRVAGLKSVTRSGIIAKRNVLESYKKLIPIECSNTYIGFLRQSIDDDCQNLGM